MTYHDKLVDYLSYCPGASVIAVPRGNLASAGAIPGVTIEEFDEYFNEFRAADGTILGRVIFTE